MHSPPLWVKSSPPGPQPAAYSQLRSTATFTRLLAIFLIVLYISLYHSMLSLCLSVSLVQPGTKSFHLVKIKLNEVAVKINHFLYQGGNEELPEREGHQFFFFHTINQLPFTSFHIF